MQFSVFNNHIKVSDSVNAIYNSFTGHLIFLGHEVDTTDISTLNENSVNNLKKGGMIVDDGIDENIMAWQHHLDSIDRHESFLLIINPTLNCNFNCWYCYESHQKDSTMGADTLTGLKNIIRKLLNEYPGITVSFFGGEPMLGYKQVVEPLMQYSEKTAKELNRQIDFAFTTNGYILTDNMLAELSKHKIAHLQISLDGAKADHDKTRVPKGGKSYDRITENIRKYATAGMKVLLRLNLTGETIANAFEIPERFATLPNEAKKYIQVSIQQVWQDRDNKTDIHQQKLNLYKRFYECGIQPDLPNHYTLTSPCYGDCKNSLVVNYNGDIYNCTAVDFPNEPRDGFLSTDGNVTMETDSLNRVIAKRKSNTACQNCRILPICGGGCFKSTWHSIDKEMTCNYPDDESKDKLVREVVEEKIFFSQLLNTAEQPQA